MPYFDSDLLQLSTQHSNPGDTWLDHRLEQLWGLRIDRIPYVKIVISPLFLELCVLGCTVSYVLVCVCPRLYSVTCTCLFVCLFVYLDGACLPGLRKLTGSESDLK
jgi:hypothetical protein